MVGQRKDEKSTKEFKKEVDVESGRSFIFKSLVLQNAHNFAVIENGSRDLVGCFCILEKVGMLCLEHYIFPNRCYMDCDEEK